MEKITRKQFLKRACVVTLGVGVSPFILEEIFQSEAYAHPPSDIAITFNSKTKMINAVIRHQVNNPLNHFIKRVEVYLNTKKIIEHKISRQDNNTTQTVSYLIPDAKVGDTISLEAYCNISGKLKKEIRAK
ncbi:MAG: hypothetical protein AB1629_04060 [Candidatus Omnitrophota bacterium]